MDAGGAGSGYTGSQHSLSGNSLARIRHTAMAKRPSPRKKLQTVSFLIRGSTMGGHWANTRPPILPTPNQIFRKNTCSLFHCSKTNYVELTRINFSSVHVHTCMKYYHKHWTLRALNSANLYSPFRPHAVTETSLPE